MTYDHGMSERGRHATNVTAASTTPTPPMGAGWVLIVDDDLDCALATARVLGASVDCEIATSPAEALERQASRPGLVAALVDLHLDGPSGDLDGIRDVAVPLDERVPGIDIRIFTGAPRGHADIQRVVDEGYWFVLKGQSGRQLRTLGLIWRRLATAIDDDEATVQHRIGALRAAGKLTARQLEIVALKARGYSNARVAQLLGISVKAVEHHSAESRRRTSKSLFEHAHDLVEGTGRVLRRVGRNVP